MEGRFPKSFLLWKISRMHKIRLILRTLCSLTQRFSKCQYFATFVSSSHIPAHILFFLLPVATTLVEPGLNVGLVDPREIMLCLRCICYGIFDHDGHLLQLLWLLRELPQRLIGNRVQRQYKWSKSGRETGREGLEPENQTPRQLLDRSSVAKSSLCE